MTSRYQLPPKFLRVLARCVLGLIVFVIFLLQASSHASPLAASASNSTNDGHSPTADSRPLTTGVGQFKTLTTTEAAPNYQQCTQVEITSPRPEAELRGIVTIEGSASIDNFQFYKVEYSTADQPDLWRAVSQTYNQPIVNGILDRWNTPALPDGEYNLKLTVVDVRGQEVCRYFVRNLAIANTQTTVPDNFADLGNLEDEAQHNLIGWGATQGPPENPHVSPSGDTTKRYQALRTNNSLDLGVEQVNVPYLLTTEVEDGVCTDNFEIYVNGEGPLYRYQGVNAGTANVDVVPHRVVVPAEYATQPRVTVTFRNTSTDDCGLAAVYNVALKPDVDMALAKRYAPFLWLHSDDPYKPNPVSVMLDNATLRWPDLTDPLAYPPLSPVYLGGLTVDGYYTDLHYASYDKAEAHRNHYEDRVKESNKVPRAYARVKRNATHTVIQYWLFYYFNDSINKHEGDWEMVQVVLVGTGSDPIPFYAAYAQHTTGSKRPWPIVEKKIDDYPVVYVAKGSHASYFKKGRHSVDTGPLVRFDIPWVDTTEQGSPLSLAGDRLELLRGDENPPDPQWLQFAGRWGEASDNCGLGRCGPHGPGHGGNREKWEKPYTWSESLPWDELASHYNITTRVSLANCQSHSLYLVDIQGRRIGPDVNEMDPSGQSAEYIRNCDPGGAGRQTILIHNPGVEVTRIDLLPDVTATSEAGEVRTQQTQAITLEVNLPDFANNRVNQATYTDVTVGITTTGFISVTTGGDLVLELDDDGDGTTDQTVTPTLEETEQDFTAPGVVSDLVVTDVITGAVTLSWTAPGDDGMAGTAASYDLRYYTEPITATNWVSAIQVVSQTVPVAAGMTQTATVDDLLSGTLYFAVRATDEFGNVDDISNSPGATVVGYPECDFDRS